MDYGIFRSAYGHLERLRHLQDMEPREGCGLCGGYGFIGTGMVRQSERVSIVNGRSTVRHQRFDIRQPCPACRGTGERTR